MRGGCGGAAAQPAAGDAAEPSVQRIRAAAAADGARHAAGATQQDPAGGGPERGRAAGEVPDHWKTCV